jgi:hypothetical protein
MHTYRTKVVSSWKNKKGIETCREEDSGVALAKYLTWETLSIGTKGNGGCQGYCCIKKGGDLEISLGNHHKSKCKD